MNRLLLPRIAALLIFVVLVGRLYQLQLVDTEANKYRYATRVRTTRFLPVRPIRGEIFAADGRTLLAESVPIFSVSIRPADLPDLETEPGKRAAVFARLGQLLGISTTLTISPAAALDQDPLLRSDLIQGLGLAAVTGAQRHTDSPPLRFSLAAEQGGAALALASRYKPVVQYQGHGVPPPALGAVPALTGTLTISPAAALEQTSGLRDDLQRLLGAAALDNMHRPGQHTWASLVVPPSRSGVALKISTTYTTTIVVENPIATLVDRANIPGFQTVPIKQDVPREIALVLRENSADLPGVVVEQDYRRRYPLSEQVESLSHILGYIGRVSECDLARGNPARSWTMSLLEAISHATECGVIQKQINPTSLGIERYLNDDRIGKDGLEASFEDDLRGQLGIDSILVDALNRPVRAPQTVQPARDGYNLMLTIDVGFQRQVEQILRNWIDVGEQRRLKQTGVFAYKRDYKPIRSGVAIVLDVHTGHVLAMVSWPAYDNNIWDPARAADLARFEPTDPEAHKEWVRLAPLVNHAIAGQYPPGSTLKQFDAAIALQDGVITPETKVRDPGRLIIEDQYVAGRLYPFVNSTSRDNGELTVSDALKVSSNIFFMTVAGGNKGDHVKNLKPEEQNIDGGLRIDRLAEGLGWFGFGKPTNIALAGELKGRVPTPKWKQEALLQAWATGDTYNMAIGQGHLEVTPLQLITAGAAVANGGDLFQPQLVKAIANNSGDIVQQLPPHLTRHIDVDPKYFSVVREGMRRSVTEGVNVAARDDCSGLAIAGKTGTAEFGAVLTVPTTNGKGTRQVQQSHSWFVGFAPYDNPQIEVLALVEGTGDLGDGSATIAVPAVTQIMQAYFKVMPPNPLPRGCQQDMPPLPPRVDPNARPGEYVRSGPGR